MSSALTSVKSFLADLLLWAFFVGGLAAGGAAGAVLDGTRKDVVTYGGSVVALLAGSRIAAKPRIRAFLSRPGTLWFLFLFNGVTAVVLYVVLGGVDGIIAAAAMGLVSLGAAGGLVGGRRRRTQEAAPRGRAARTTPGA
ncbi:hypothetical protein [Streptomyces sp. NPDC057253]|uniref:hypothetical protein n=1 Tax=Streptomyces sp. NPDC057253 TaxID=3346069 RepID=UPI003643B0FE